MAGEGMILRLQDENGRGPFRPGWSHTWVDGGDDRTGLPALWEEMEDFREQVAKWHRLGHHVGCAVRGFDGIRNWFSRQELIKLRMNGFDIYRVDNPIIIFESPVQIMFAKKHALRKLPKAGVMDQIIASYQPEGSIWTDE